MDINNTTPSRFELGIQIFLEGKPISFNDVRFWKEDGKSIHIDSYSEWDIENSTREMAKEKITRSKAVLADLSGKSPEFERVIRTLPHQYYFCFDYGNGSVALAKEVNGEFTWLR